MLEIGGLGFLRAIRPGSRKLKGDVSILLVDEPNRTLWLWLGSGVQYDKRRKAQMKVEEISKNGHRIGGELLGAGFPVVVIDQDSLEDPTTAHNYSNIISMLEQPMEISTVPNPQGTLIFAQIEGVVAKAAPVASTPSAPAESMVSAPTVAEPRKEVAPTAPKKGTGFALEAALMAILRVHQTVHIEFRQKGDTEELIVEAVDGLSHQMKRRKGKLTFKWDPKTPKELKDLVALELKRLAA